MESVDDIGKLVAHLEICARTGAGAHLTPDLVERLLVALRAHIEAVEQSQPAFEAHPFQVVAVVAEGSAEEILALASDALIARAIFDEAAEWQSGRKIRLKHHARVLAESA
ncbi:hypothetical protein [Methylocapsa sp. S129]|uniref:hypothetical protein n=1 Tax=Methylocapsa sp. S129 TaxID=1641869 RepID=UPI00131C101F|nr:hypothetical protein [Methylocapsa sp. S129]